MVTTLLGIDYGKKRVGVAVGNSLTKSAEPLLIIDRQSDAQVVREIQTLVAQWQTSALVLGIPRQPDGAPHEMTVLCEGFANTLRSAFGVVHEVDERYSSAVLATKSQRRADGSVREKRQDDLAAAVILQQYLDGL